MYMHIIYSHTLREVDRNKKYCIVLYYIIVLYCIGKCVDCRCNYNAKTSPYVSVIGIARTKIILLLHAVMLER